MRAHLDRIATELALMCLLAGAFPVRAEFKKNEWSHRVSITVPDDCGKGLIELPLSPTAFELAQQSLADLRVTDGAGVEIGYVVRIADSKAATVPLPVTLYNRAYLPGKQSSVTADFGLQVLKNRIRVVTAGANFRRRLMIEGSDDGEAWQRIREDAFLFRIPKTSASKAYDRNIVELPDNRQRYLRLTVFNAADDPERVEIEEVGASRQVAEPPETELVPGPTTIKQEKSETVIGIDLAWQNMPLYDLKLAFRDDNFFRRVSVLGRNAEQRVIRVSREEGAPVSRTVEEPWTPITNGAIYRYSAGGSVDESQILPLSGAKYRYLQVRIENGDDAPLLRFNGADLRLITYYVAFQSKGARDYFLYLGNPKAGYPSYDIAHYMNRLRSEGVIRPASWSLSPNPDYGAREVIPWSERHKWILWAALLAVGAVLGFLVYRQVKSAPPAPG